MHQIESGEVVKSKKMDKYDWLVAIITVASIGSLGLIAGLIY